MSTARSVHYSYEDYVRALAGGWNTREVRAGKHVVLQDPKLSLSVDALYAGVSLDPA